VYNSGVLATQLGILSRLISDTEQTSIPTWQAAGINVDDVIGYVQIAKDAVSKIEASSPSNVKEDIDLATDKIKQLSTAANIASDALIEMQRDSAEQAKYIKFDQSQVKMPTAKQLQINGVVKGLTLWGGIGWSNGHILDLIQKPKVVTDAIDKYYNDENSASIRKIEQDKVDQILNRAKSNHLVVEPVAYYDETGTSKKPLRMFILMDAAREFAVNAFAPYFNYFEKIYKGPTYYAGEGTNDPILVKKGGEIVGIIMPARIGPNVIQRAMKASSPAVPVEAPPATVQEESKAIESGAAANSVPVVQSEEIPAVTTAAAPEPVISEPVISQEKQAALDLLQSVIDGKADLMDSDLSNQLEDVYNKFQGDSDVMAKFDSAAAAYATFMVENAKVAISG